MIMTDATPKEGEMHEAAGFAPSRSVDSWGFVRLFLYFVHHHALRGTAHGILNWQQIQSSFYAFLQC